MGGRGGCISLRGTVSGLWSQKPAATCLIQGGLYTSVVWEHWSSDGVKEATLSHTERQKTYPENNSFSPRGHALTSLLAGDTALVGNSVSHTSKTRGQYSWPMQTAKQNLSCSLIRNYAARRSFRENCSWQKLKPGVWLHCKLSVRGRKTQKWSRRKSEWVVNCFLKDYSLDLKQGGGKHFEFDFNDQKSLKKPQTKPNRKKTQQKHQQNINKKPNPKQPQKTPKHTKKMNYSQTLLFMLLNKIWSSTPKWENMVKFYYCPRYLM